MPFQSPVSEISHYLRHVVDADRLSQTKRFTESGLDTIEAVMTEAAKIADDVFAPVNRAGDETPTRLENGVIRTCPEYRKAYAQFAEGGWVAIAADESFGGMGLPMLANTAVNEMVFAGCLSLSLAPLLTQGQIEALEHHGSDELKATYLPKLISGEWIGTMNLSEPQAGSDVGALRTKAERNDDGTYSISGNKIWISWGDADFATNVCHLVLARLPDGAKGTKGISLFMVPKFIPDENGAPGKRNGVQVVSIEEKLGLHGSPTCVMEYENATGWLVGEEHDGMAAMFTMMNNARLGVGVQGLAIAEAAYQKARDYAEDRVQGRVPVEGYGKAIIAHADVRRMLMEMKALTSVARGLCLDCALSIDMAKATGDPAWSARAAALTPMAKAFGTEAGMRVAEWGVQVHGGMGFVEETGAAQYYRDVRVTAIYEGTNGIQAMDLVARKMADGGDALRALMDEVEATAQADEDGAPLLAALKELRATTDWMLAADLNDRFAGAMPYLTAFSLVLGGHYLIRAATDAPHRDLARYFLANTLADASAQCVRARQGAELLYNQALTT